MSGHPFKPPNQRPLGGRLVTPAFIVLLALFAITLPVIIWRFVVGLGPSTGMSDGYPWGIWIAFDVVTGTALASGGFAVALMVFILNRWRYHPVVRPAILTACLGYTIAVFSLIVDVGRPWNFWKVPIKVGDWNVDSALLEVALCIAVYVIVLWIEVAPALLEKLETNKRPWLRRVSRSGSRVLTAALPWLIAVGVVLPMMHQSSLGSLMILTGGKLHALWQTPMLPILFLISSFAMGLGAVILESVLASAHFRRPMETRILRGLAQVALVAIGLFLAVRIVDLVARGAPVLSSGRLSLMLLLETAAFVAAAILFWPWRHRRDPGWLLRSAVVLLVAGTLYRFDAFLVGFDPGTGWTYFPTVPELAITFGFVALEVAAYLFIVRQFPILRGIAAPQGRQA